MSEQQPEAPAVPGDLIEPATETATDVAHEHWFHALWSHFGQYGPQDVHYHPCCEGEPSDCYAVMMGAGRDCGGPGSPHERMTLAEDGPQPAEALERLRAAESDSPADPPEDTSRALSTRHAAPRERSGATSGEAAEGLRELAVSALAGNVIHPCCKVCDAQIGAAMTVLGPLLDRADAAEAKLAELRGVLLEGGQDAGTVRRQALAIIGTEKETDHV